ncbi:MAG TPA: CHASE3 domain-containing protein [Opitutaceae bacterium]|nr:CHASE3 domain-containing protein [Opitutaceae bacterium]
MSLSLERRTFLGFGFAVLALLLTGGAAWWSAARYRETFLRVDHTREVLNRIESALNDVLGIQANVRGYALTGDLRMLQAKQEADPRLTTTLQELRRLVADNPAQQKRLDALDPLLAQFRGLIDGHIAARRSATADNAVVDRTPFLRGTETVLAIQQIGADMEEEERELLQRRIDRMNRSGRWTLAAITGTSALATISVFVAGLLLRRDLIARTRAEASLRESEERVRLMVGNVKDYAIVILDPGGRITGWNAGARQLKGYNEAEILGQHFSRFYPAEAREQGFPEKELATAAGTGRFEEENWRVRKDGSRFWAHVVLTAVRDRRGALLGFIKITRDLTEQREAQNRIQALNDDLRRRAAQLEAANAELEAFSYSVSHDLRAPLRHIDGFSGLLASHAGEALDAESKRYLQTISRAARQMGALIDDLLAFSRIGRTPLRLDRVGTAELVANTITEARYEADGRRIEWEIGALPDVVGDTSMLRQVWRNLLDNAAKYSGKAAQPRIAVGGRLEAAAGEYVFFVRDNGVGFDMAYADKLFGVFQRLHSPAEFEGTGIGLANVRRIVTRHHGRTWAEGRVGEGATFYFSLPVNPPASPSA